MHFKKRLASSLLTFNISFQLYYTIVLLVLFHYRLKNEIYYVHSLLKFRATQLWFRARGLSGDLTGYTLDRSKQRNSAPLIYQHLLWIPDHLPWNKNNFKMLQVFDHIKLLLFNRFKRKQSFLPWTCTLNVHNYTLFTNKIWCPTYQIEFLV